MATELNQTEAPVAQEAPVASPEQISQGLGTPNLSQPLMAPISAGEVYSPLNVQQVLSGSNKSYEKMKLSKLEKNIANAQSVAEMNAINIKNQPVAMGVMTGQMAHQSAIDSARLNAVTGMYNVKLLDEQRKEAKKAQEEAKKEQERQNFLSQYGADPNSRPKGMSKREFIIELQAGRQNDKLTTEFKSAQLDLQSKQKSLSGGGTVAGGDPVLSALDTAFNQTGGDWGKTVEILAKNYDVSSGSVIDNELRRRNGLPPIVQQTATERLAQEKLQQSDQEAVDMAKAAIPDLEKKLGLLDSAGTRGVGAGVTGAIERNFPDLFGTKADNLGVIKAIIGTETLQTLLNLKAKGGTLGAISEKELSILQSSASRIGAAEINDGKGNVAGYRMTEGEFKKEIQSMKEATQRVLDEARKKAGVSGSQGTKVIAPDGQEIIIID